MAAKCIIRATSFERSVTRGGNDGSVFPAHGELVRLIAERW